MEKYKEIINGSQPVLVDFFAAWCGPCKMLHPVIEELAKELQGKARFLRVDIDKNRPVANAYQIQSVPTLMIFKEGKMLWRGAGYMDKETLRQKLEEFL